MRRSPDVIRRVIAACPRARNVAARHDGVLSFPGKFSDSSRNAAINRSPSYGSNEKMRFQSSFMLMTIHPSFFASSSSALVKVPTFVSGSPRPGP